MQTSVRAQIDYCFARGAELKEHVSHLGSFLAQICFNHSISEPSGVSFQPFCLLPVSGVVMLLLATSWFKPRKIEIKPRSSCAGDELASLLAASPFDRDKFTGLSVSMLELLRSPLIWIGPLVLPIEHIEPPAAAWLREWLQLFRLETRLPWPTHAESLTIVELGNEVFYCA